ncbi:CIA30 family protein [Pelagibacteraceae bacterium]|nr:CIA30 family protein [Pelagibacteraceae bacterium]
MYKLLFSLLIFYSSVVFSKDQISIPFTEENARYWQYISDQTMGGVSDGQAILDKDGDMIFARLTGNVSTANNGGFIQIRTNFSFVDLINTNKDLKGVLLNTKGNGETYHIFIRTSEDRSYRDFYSATFTTNDNWEIVDLPFSKFKHRYSNRSLDGNDIRTFGIVAYGRSFYSDVSVSEISFYD